jgi:hypothetical protein
LPGAEEVVFVDLDSTHRQVYGYARQGAEVGRLRGKKTLHPLIATASTPIARPVVVAVRMRKGKAADVRGAARFLAEALTTVRAIAPTTRIVVRGDSTFYTAGVVATAARYGAAVSLTTGSNPSVNTAITTIPHTAWRAIHYPNAFVDDQSGELVSDAALAEIPYTAFTSRPRHQQVAGRLIVRRVKRLNPKTAPSQDGLSTCGVTTRCSSPATSRRYRPNPSTAATPSSNSSSPMPPAARWRTCPRDPSPRTRPGRSSGRLRTISRAPRVRLPAPSTPARAPRRSAPI